MKRHFYRFFVTFLCVIFLWPHFSYAINLPWVTTFDYPECTQRGGGGSIDCETVQNDGIYWSWGGGDVEGHYTQVSEAANYSGGLGGNGLRHWKGSGADNLQSDPVRIDFQEPQKELWIRWYERYENGFEWGGRINTKSLYFRAGVSSYGPGSFYAGFRGDNFWIFNQGGNYSGYEDIPTGNIGWPDIYPGGVSDGSWHCFEIYVKMDTGGNDGKAGIWVNGELAIYREDINWSSGDATALNGWTWFQFPSNQKDPRLDRPYYLDFDDMVIYNQTPPNFDTQGNPFIGPIVLTQEDTTPPAAPSGLSVS